MPDFVPGQRWLSETQSELGLGIVTAVTGRCVQIDYPATGETRLYAMADAPLARVTLAPGEQIRDLAGQRLKVIEARANDGLLVYFCETPDGTARTLPESALDPELRFNRPQQRLLSGRCDSDRWFTLRYRTRLQQMQEAGSPVRGLLGARVALIPHQLYLAAEVAKRAAPRVLLADEVGLGKTVEAGLILHRMLLTGAAQRVLVVTPEPLLHQWLLELRRRFNLRFALFDRERIAALADAHPFRSEQLALCGLELLVACPDAERAALAEPWDLLVVDEAHRLAWSATEVSPEYALIATLAERTPGVLLLTATPEQLGQEGHFGRLRLLDPARFYAATVWQDEAARYAPIAELVLRLLDGNALTVADRALLAALPGDFAELSQDALVERLLDCHGTGRVLFRNARAAIPGFPQREWCAYSLDEPAEYRALTADAVARLTPERAFGTGWSELDPRLDWLIATLRALRPAKALLICTHAQTVIELREALFRRAGIHAAIFHEGMELVERDRAAAYFAADGEGEGAQILLCSEIGSEGRNFQCVHHLVLFDLPLAPELLEQRIGRLDRIGQAETVRIHFPVLTGSPGAVLFRWYAEGLQAFAAICPAASAVADRLRDTLLAALEDPRATPSLLAATQRLVSQLNAALAAGRDRLLELHSHRPAVSAALVAAIETLDASREVAEYMQRFWDAFGVDYEPGCGASVVVRPGSEMLHETFPGLPEDGLTATFSRADALAHEDREFLTWEHPMVRDAMELLTASDLGGATMTVVRDGRFKQPTLLLEMLYAVDCPAPPELQVGRFLPPTTVRLLLDGNGRNLADEFAHDTLRGECLAGNRPLARALLQSQAPRLVEMIEQGERLAQAARGTLEAEAMTRMQVAFDAELARLTALAQIALAVRAERSRCASDEEDRKPQSILDERERQRRQRERLAQALTRVALRLDALRVVVMA